MAHGKVHDRDRMWAFRDHEGELEHDGNDPTVSPTTPLLFGSTSRRLGVYPRSQSMNGRIQKSNFVRSQSFSGSKAAKAALRSHHMENLHAQLISYMKATGIDQHKVVLLLEKLKETHTTKGSDQQQPDHSQVKCSPPRNPLRMDDPPVEASTITLLQQKFAQLERYKESVQGQHIQLYPNQAQNPQQQQPGPPCSSPNGFYHPFVEPSAAAQQQALLTLSRSSSAKSTGTADDALETSESYPNQLLTSSVPKDPNTSPNGSADNSSSSKAATDNINALLHYMLQPPSINSCNVNKEHQQNLTAFQKMDLSGAIMSGLGTEHMCGLSADSGVLGLGLGIGKETSSTTKFVMSTSPLHRAGTKSAAKQQLPVGWGDGLTLLTCTPTLSPASSGGWESEASDAWRSSSSSESIDERESCTELDTSLHL